MQQFKRKEAVACGILLPNSAKEVTEGSWGSWVVPRSRESLLSRTLKELALGPGLLPWSTPFVRTTGGIQKRCAGLLTEVLRGTLASVRT